MNRSLKHLLPLLAAAVLPHPAAAKSKAPIITSISGIAATATQTITITGSNFGTLAPYTGDSNYIAFNVCPTSPFKFSCKGGWQGGYAPDGNGAGLIVQSWTDTQIVIGGVTDYGGLATFVNGGTVHVEIFNVPSLKHGKTSACIVTVGAGAVTC